MKPRALDLFCGAGGATRGLQHAGFHVTGIDIVEQPNYVGDDFIKLDVLEGIKDGRFCWPMWDLVWASPPCQGRTAYKRRPGHVKPVDTDGAIIAIRQAFTSILPVTIIENVPGAPLNNPIMLCGSMFDLDVRRHRKFECSFPCEQRRCQHELQQGDFPQATNRKNRRKTCEVGVWRIPLEVQCKAMGIDWMTLEELSEAIPPAYSEYIGTLALDWMRANGRLAYRE